jgi:hypothetical protein
MKTAVFTMKIEADLRDAFMAEADAMHRPASQLVRELMRDFIDARREKRDYVEFLRAKVDLARTSAQLGFGRSNEDVEAEFAARRAQAVKKA